MNRVLLVVMPFGTIDSPPVGISTLKAQFQRAGIPCDIAYFNLRFAKTIGYQRYMYLTSTAGEMLVGEWLFSSALFGRQDFHYHDFIGDILIKEYHLGHHEIRDILDIGQYVEPFLEHCLGSVDWKRYNVIGFTSMFEQNLAVLSLAYRIKKRFPQKTIVLGGANCAGEMGLQLHKSFSFVDFVFTGEADFTFAELVSRLGNKNAWQSEIKDLVWRDGDKSVFTGAAPLITNLDSLPYPNYDDFFEQFHSVGLPRHLIGDVSIETSRGCWWGQKRQCRFCGLNNNHIEFRAKSPERTVDEILHLSERHKVKIITAVDNIIPKNYFDTVLRELKFRNTGISLFYETKANLKKEQIKLFKDSGVIRIQPGVEAFSRNVLKQMKKGVSPLQNAQLLKWCKEYDLDAAWNLLYGLPGENAKDYQETLNNIRSLEHLQPPLACGWIRLHRFSPLFVSPDEFGIRHIHPLKSYRYIYSLTEDEIANIAYNFEFDFDGKEKTERLAFPVHHQIDHWQRHHTFCRLEVVESSPHYMIVGDTRTVCTFPYFKFHNPEMSIISFCDKIRNFHTIFEYIKELNNVSELSESWLRDFLNYLVTNRLVLTENDHYLSLILPKKISRQSGMRY